MQLISTHQNNVTLVDMPTRLVYANTESLKTQLFALLNKAGTVMSLNVAQVEFIDSSGLAVLVAAYKKAQQHNCQLVLQSPSENVHVLLELTALAEVFAIYPDQAAVMAKFASAEAVL